VIEAIKAINSND